MKSTKDTFSVFGLGSIAVDFLGTSNIWPEEGAKVPLSDLTVQDGGLVATALVAVSRLGGRAAFAGKLGFSTMAQRALSGLQSEGIDTSFVIRQEGAEPIVSFVVNNSTSGERTLFYSRQGVEYPVPQEFADKDWFTRVKVLLVDHESGVAGVEAARIAHEQGLPVVIDVEQEGPYVSAMMGYASDIIVSESFARVFTGKHQIGEMLESLCVSTGQTVIITRGDKGFAGWAKGVYFEKPAYSVKAVDTTGCGDVFHGAYALFLAQGRSAEESAQYANAAAALCSTQIGGRSGIPTEQQLDQFLTNQTGT